MDARVNLTHPADGIQDTKPPSQQAAVVQRRRVPLGARPLGVSWHLCRAGGHLKEATDCGAYAGMRLRFGESRCLNEDYYIILYCIYIF